jgi:acyl-CoA thioester hydrolase
MRDLHTNYPVRIPLQTRFSDTDASGHINNVALMAYFELGRAYYFKALKGQFNRSGKGFILGSIEAKFLRQAFFGDELVVESGITGVGRSSFRISCRIVEAKSGEIVAESQAIVVSFDFSKGSSTPLPESWKRLVAEAEGIEPEALASDSLEDSLDRDR